MPAPTKYPVAHEQLLELARAARAEGMDFDSFWERAVRPGMVAITWARPEEKRPVGCVVWPSDTADRQIAVAATLGAREGWRRAYDQIPMKAREAALGRIRPGLEALAERRAS
jgi:hypothetical protein